MCEILVNAPDFGTLMILDCAAHGEEKMSTFMEVIQK